MLAFIQYDILNYIFLPVFRLDIVSVLVMKNQQTSK